MIGQKAHNANTEKQKELIQQALNLILEKHQTQIEKQST